MKLTPKRIELAKHLKDLEKQTVERVKLMRVNSLFEGKSKLEKIKLFIKML